VGWFTEKVYERGLIIELRERRLSTESQKAIMLNYKRYDIGKHILDLIVEDKVIIELKAVSEFLPIHEAQLISYLKASGYKVGLLLNFSNTSLQYKRIVLTG